MLEDKPVVGQKFPLSGVPGLRRSLQLFFRGRVDKLARWGHMLLFVVHELVLNMETIAIPRNEVGTDSCSLQD